MINGNRLNKGRGTNMKKLISFLILGCFCLSAVAIASDGFSSIGKELRAFDKEAVDKGVTGLSREELKVLVAEIIEISLKKFEKEFSSDPNYMSVSEEEKETGRKEVMNILIATPGLLEQARDENGEVSAKKLVEILKAQGRAETELIVAKTNIDMLETSLRLYELDNGFYPSTSQSLSALKEKPTSDPKPIGWNSPYLKEIPEDPWGNPYHYVYPGIQNKEKFDLSSYGPDEVESDDDVTNWK